MLSFAINILCTVAGLIALATIAHCLIEVRAAYARLMREGDVLRAGRALQAAAVEMSLRPAPRRLIATRRVALPVGAALLRPAFAA